MVRGAPLLAGGMQHWPLTVNKILDHAATCHGEQEIISRGVEGGITITTYAGLRTRAQLCSLALQSLGIKEASIVATLAWNHRQHAEAWYGIMGLGAVVHTLNPRLADKDLRWITNDARDVLLMVDSVFAAQVERIMGAGQVPSIKAVIFLTDRQNMPTCKVPCPVLCYEELLGAQAQPLRALAATGGFQWAQIEEEAACSLCYTSGTTGNPKGVLMSHRATFLHALMVVHPDSLPLSSASTVLAIVPMFHASCWGLIFAAPLVGARLVLPGPWLDGQSVLSLIDNFKITLSAGVPTVWLSMLAVMEQQARVGFKTPLQVVIGGAAAPRAMIECFEKRHGVEVRHMWGMTELCPTGTVGALKAPLQGLPLETQLTYKNKQGRPHILCEMRIVDDTGKVQPHDGQAVGDLQVRGPHTISEYLNAGKLAVDKDGWFSTGDVASIDALGHMAITDRSKDVIKSGGEWISSQEIEGLAMGHACVAEAAAIAIPDIKYTERPLLVVVLKPGVTTGLETIRVELYKIMEVLAKYAVPDAIVFLEELPHTATGKVSKLTLRTMFADHKPAPRSRI